MASLKIGKPINNILTQPIPTSVPEPEKQYKLPLIIHTDIGPIVLVNIGKLVTGREGLKYWFTRKNNALPVPIGYTAKSKFFGRDWRMSVDDGVDGPLFTVN